VVEDDCAVCEPGAFVLIRRGQRHTWWNPGDETAVFLTVISPAGLEAYFAELAAGLARAASSDEADALRSRLSRRYDVDVVGPGLS
jgi:hypothetical protein